MKFFHISDLHIGKKVCGFSMLEDQRYILQQIIGMAQEHKPDGILIAGDLYDKSMPSAEAVELADWFLSRLAQLGLPVWVISGNHDSAERIAYGGQIMEKSGVHMSRVFDGTMQGYLVTKHRDGTKQISRIGAKADGSEAERERTEAGKADSGCDYAEHVCIWLLPYLRPAHVRRFFPEHTIETTQQAVEAVLATCTLPKDKPNILVMHQFLAGASVCDSEEISVGGLDQVAASTVEAFDYVALGHLHRPQNVERDTVRYCGSPLKYSFSEAGHRKSVTVVETDGRTMQITTLPLLPRLDLREIKGPIAKLLQKEVSSAANREDYLHITLTDTEEVLDAIGKLRQVYPNIMRLDFECNHAAHVGEETEILVDEKTSQELFEEFFFMQNGREMNDAQRRLAEEVLRDAAAGRSGIFRQ